MSIPTVLWRVSSDEVIEYAAAAGFPHEVGAKRVRAAGLGLLAEHVDAPMYDERDVASAVTQIYVQHDLLRPVTTARRSTAPRRPARRTATDRYAVATDYGSGMTVAAIAEKHRIGVTPLYRILDELGIERRQVHQPKLPAGQRRRGSPAAPSTGQQTSRSWRRTRLAEIDVDALISDYGNEELTVTAICATHKIGLTKLYQLLDRHRVARRRPNAPKIPLRRRRSILDDYLAGVGVAEIARRHRVSESTVSLIAQREGVSRVRARTREEIVDLAVAWLMGDDVERESLTVLQHVGCRLSARGLRSIVTMEPAIQADVARQVAIAISNRYG